MKKTIITIIALVFSVSCFAQKQELQFPFQGGKEKMTRFFKDSIKISDAISKRKLTGVVMVKFTADEQGAVQKIVVYYADDASLVPAVVDAVKKSNDKWVIPSGEKTHDFVMPFYIRFNLPEIDDPALQKATYQNYKNKRAIFPNNQIPLDVATLLPSVTISYDVMM